MLSFLRNGLQKTIHTARRGFANLEILEMAGGTPTTLLIGGGMGATLYSTYILNTKPSWDLRDTAGLVLYSGVGSLLWGIMPASSTLVMGIACVSVLSVQMFVAGWNRMILALKARQQQQRAQNRLA
jgi:hypothetical protein